MTVRQRSVFTAGITLAALFQVASAQRYGGALEPRWKLDGSQISMANGFAVIEIPDIDGDGITDVVTSAPYFDSPALADNGSVVALSGDTGLPIWFHDGRSNFELRGFAIAPAGDWSSPPDGICDVMAGSPLYDPGAVTDTGLVKIIDSTTGIDLWTYVGVNAFDFFGSAVVGGFDYDSDGDDDVLIGAPGFDGSGFENGRVYLYSNRSVTPDWVFTSPALNGFAGVSLGYVGDVDGDAFGDFLVGVPRADAGGVPDAGVAYLLSGRLGVILDAYRGTFVGGYQGTVVASGRDIDGDGLFDFLVAAPNASPGGRMFAGTVEVYQGGTGALLHRLDGIQAFDELGTSVAIAEDLNHDTLPDILVGGRGLTSAGFVQVHDGLSGTRLHRLDGENPGDEFGHTVSSVGDQDGDSEIEIAVGIPGGTTLAGPGAGTLQVYRFSPGLSVSPTTVSASAGGVVNYTLDFPVSEAGLDYVLLASVSGVGPLVFKQVAIPLTYDPVLVMFATGGAPSSFSGVYGTLDASGDGVASFVAAPGALSSVVGTTVWFTAVSRTAPTEPSIASIAASLTILP